MDLSRCISMDEDSKMMIKDGINAVTVTEMWDWLKIYEPEKSEGFMFSSHPNLDKIGNNMYGGHSGASYAWTMRQLEYIAKNGFEAFVTLWNNKSKKREQFLKETHNHMTLSEQLASLEKFKDVPMSYSEMRERYG
jgi:hypothetical protein